jgi:predicted RNase H-like HicB family nuclease
MNAVMQDLEYFLAIPYIIRLESVPADGTRWIRRASHPELAGCLAEADGPEDALDLLEKRKREWLERAISRGDQVPAPRPPLAEGHFALRQEIGS